MLLTQNTLIGKLYLLTEHKRAVYMCVMNTFCIYVGDKWNIEQHNYAYILSRTGICIYFLFVIVNEILLWDP